jgi:hypothetical protein
LKSKKEFYCSNKTILESERGAGYWLWKPLIICDALNNMTEDDILVYIDAGTHFIHDIKSLIQIVQEKELLLFNNNHKNKVWTKRDCFVLMNCDEKKYHEGMQAVAGYILCKKTKFVIEFMNEWLHYAEDERIISDNKNVCGLENLEGFIEHRHDQSILTNLVIKYEIELFRDPSQYGNGYKLPEFRVPDEFVYKGHFNEEFTNSPYPTILHSHREKIQLSIWDQLDYFMLGLKKSKRN